MTASKKSTASAKKSKDGAKAKKAPVKATDTSETPRFWVGIGASAGGLEALRGLVRSLPSDLNATYVVAQHMAPHHRSMLSEIIGRETDMAVKDVTDKLTPTPNTIYITPPNYNVIVERNKIHLIEPSREPASPKPSVDVFFNSLASGVGDRAIGIVLSGTGSDGADGIRSIRRHGGITIAQDELTAKYSSMPVTAIETGCVDLVMSPEEIGAQFPRIIAEPRDLNALRSSALDNDHVSELVQLLLDQTKVNFRHYKSATFQRRVERRMAAHGVTDLEEYVRIARAVPNEVDSLFNDLLITVTSFFRDPVEFESLGRHIRTIVEEKKGEQIRVWVPGTATGEEAYTIAILFAEAMGGLKKFQDARLQIFATDIDTKAIEVARRAFYSQTSLDAVAPGIVKKYFDPAPTGFSVKKALREKIVFSIHNIAQDPPFLNLDMISCRNLLIYFQNALQAQVFARFHYALVPNGRLFLGKSESTSASDSLFRVASPDKHIFIQRPARERKPLRDPVFGATTIPTPRRSKVGSAEYRDLAVASAQFESLVRALGPNAILMDSDMRIRRAFGDLKRYVGLAPGDVDTSAMTLLNEPYRQDIRAAVPGTIRKKTVYKGIARVIDGDPSQRERIMIYPVDMGPDDETRALVVFHTWTEKLDVDEMAEPMPREWRGQVDELSRELEIARTNLQQTVEELETSNEELQALNEELQSSNEELQSTNEELETSNEELQSTNEELTTVNEELQVSSQQLKVAIQNLSSILDNVGVPMLVVDRDLNITHTSRASADIFGVSPDLVLPHVSRCRMPPEYPNLVGMVSEALDVGRRIDAEVVGENLSATLSVVPHYSAADDLIGAIIVLADNTEALKKTRNELQVIFDNLPAGFMVRDEKGEVIRANRLTQRFAGMEDGIPEGTTLFDFLTKESAEATIAADAEAIKGRKPVLNQTSRLVRKDGTELYLNASRLPIEDPETGEMRIYAMASNITEQVHAAEELALTAAQLNQAVRASRVGLWEWDVRNGSLIWSERFKDILGVDDTTFGGKFDDFADRLHAEDRGRVLKAVDEHLKNKAPFEIGYRLRHEDGHYVWIEAYGQATWAPDGTPERFVGTVADVTERKENYWELQLRNEQLAMASSLSGFGYWKIDLTNDSVYWSDQIYVIHGVDKETFTPSLESGLRFYHPDDIERVRHLVGEAIDKGKSFEFVARIVRPDGEVRVVRSLGRQDVAQDGSDAAVFGVFVDISDKEREEELRMTLAELSRSNEELNRFSYVCSHDMKEPVRMIESMSQLLLEPEVIEDQDQRGELLERIIANMRRLRSIIDSLLAYSRIDAKVEVADIDLNDVLKDVEANLTALVAQTNPDLKVGTLPVLKGARVHFTQLFQNLIGNALKFANGNQPLIEVSVRKEGDDWIFTVEDNGPGIPREHRAQVFSLFSRLHLRDEIEGTGLGLSICQRIVSQYGGTIICDESKLGGALFEIRIPSEYEGNSGGTQAQENTLH